MNTEETINAKRDAPSESAILVGLNNTLKKKGFRNIHQNIFVQFLFS